MKRTVIILLLLLAGLPLWAQETDFTVPDSLMMKLKEFRQNDDKRAQTLIDIIEYLFETRQHEQLMTYTKELRNLKYYIEGNYYQKAQCDYYLGFALGNTGQLYESLEWYNLALEELANARSTHETRMLQTRVLLSKSSKLFELNLYPEEYQALMEGIAIAKEEADSIRIGNLYNNLGLLYQSLTRFDESFVAFHQSLAYYPNNFNALINISISHQLMKKLDSTYLHLDSTYFYLDKALFNANRLLDSIEVLHRMGSAKGLEGKLKEASQHLQKALEKSAHPSIPILEQCLILRELAVVENQLGEQECALNHISEAIHIGEEANLFKVLVYSYSVRSNIERDMGNYQAALQDANNFMEVYDQVNILKDAKKIADYEREHDNRIAVEQIRHERIQAQQQRRNTLFIACMLVMFAIVITTLLLMLNRKRQKVLQLELDAQNREVTSKTMEQMRLNQSLKDAVTKLTFFANNPKGKENSLETAIRDLKGMIDDGTEKDFDYYFTQVHTDFYKKLQADHPELTPNDLRLCAYIKSNLNVKDVAELTGISVDSVKAARSRLRKKLGIEDPHASLLKFLSKY